MIQAILPYPQIDPVLVHLGPLAIRWYALAYIAGLAAGLVGRSCASCADKQLWATPPFNGKPPATDDQIGDLVVWATFGVILGGRLGWVPVLRHHPVQRLARMPASAAGLPMGFLTDPDAHHRRLGRRHVVPWRAARRGASRSGCSAAGASSQLLPVADLVCACRADRPVLRPHRQFHQWRIVGPSHRCALGDDLSRAGAGPHLPRHPSQLYEAALEGAVAVRDPADLPARLPAASSGPACSAAIFFLRLWHLPLHRANSSASPTRRSSARSAWAWRCRFRSGWRRRRCSGWRCRKPHDARMSAASPHRGADRGAGPDLRRAIS